MKTPKILEIEAALQLQKPAHVVFEAIVNPDQMAHYFIATSTGKMETSAELTWRFPEFDMDVPVRVGEIRQDEYISYFWKHGDRELFVEMTLRPISAESTVLEITEKNMPNDELGIKWLKGNTFGWANFLDCLKAYLEFGINLRKGGFDFRRK